MTKPQDSRNPREARCDLLGDLAARAAEERPADFRQWAAIEGALAARPGFVRRRWLVLVFPTLALAGLAVWIAADRTLGWRVQDCALVSDGSLSAAADRACTVAFDDGTVITLGKTSLGRVRALGFRRGAQLELQNGHVDLSVVHRPGCRWEVLTGSLQVEVTGTRFAVDWAPGSGHFSLGVREGEVRVSGDPLRETTPVRAGQRLEVDMAAPRVFLGDLVAPPSVSVQAPAAPAAAAEIQEKAAAQPATISPVARVERKRGATSKIALHSPSLSGKARTPAESEAPVGLGLASPDWTASAAADERPAPEASGPRRLTVGKNGELAGGGPLRALRGSGTSFSSRAGGSAEHLYLEDGRLCTSGRISPLACSDDVVPGKRCDADTNWGVLVRWYPRPDQKAWGSRANSKIAMEFRGKPGRYRLVAHRQGDPAQAVFCVENYLSGRTEPASEFQDCRVVGGPRLSDFTEIDYFALQVLSEEVWRPFGFCLSAVNLF